MVVDMKSEPMETLHNAKYRVTSYVERMLQAIPQYDSISGMVRKATKGEMFALVVNEFNIEEIKKYKHVWAMFVLGLAALFFYSVYKAGTCSFATLKATARLSWEIISVFLCIVIVVNIIR